VLQKPDQTRSKARALAQAGAFFFEQIDNVKDRYGRTIFFSDSWRQVDATPGNSIVKYINLWDANDLSDGCFVEFKLTE